MKEQRGFTLIEMILALGLTVIVVGLVSMAVGTQLRLAATGRAQVQEAQLARALLHRIADDLHNAVPYSAKGLPGTGLSGTENQLQVDVYRPGSVSPSGAVAAADDTAAAGRALDVRTVCYYLGNSGDVAAAEEDAGGTAGGSPGGPPGEAGGMPATGGGLIRTEVSRAVASWAAQQGGGDPSQLGPATIVPEVVDIEFAYYDSTGTENDEWDCSEQQGLPYAVKASVTIRHPSRKPATATEGQTDDRAELAVYSLLVPLANTAPPGSSSDTSAGSTATGGAGSGASGGSAGGSESPASGPRRYNGSGDGTKRGEKGGKGGDFKGQGGKGGEPGGKGGPPGNYGKRGGKGGEYGPRGGKGGPGGGFGPRGGKGGEAGPRGGKGGEAGPRGGKGGESAPRGGKGGDLGPRGDGKNPPSPNQPPPGN